MEVYLPLAEMTVPAEAVIALGTGVGFLSGMFGVGGGFLTTPLLIFMGVPSAIAVGTQANQLVASSLSGVLGHWRRGNVDVKMALIMLSGSVLGSLIGVLVFKLMQHIGQIDFLIPFLYVLILGGMGSTMLFDTIKGLFVKTPVKKRGSQFYKKGIWRRLPYRMRFPRSRIYISALLPAGIGFMWFSGIRFGDWWRIPDGAGHDLFARHADFIGGWHVFVTDYDVFDCDDDYACRGKPDG